MATPTSSSNRSKRKGTKPITQGQNPQRGNRQKVSNAQVTNSSTRGSNTGSAKVTTGRGASKPAPKALPPGTKGGALATQGRAPLKGQPQLPPGRKGGSVEKAGPTVDVKANAAKLPSTRTGGALVRTNSGPLARVSNAASSATKNLSKAGRALTGLKGGLAGTALAMGGSAAIDAVTNAYKGAIRAERGQRAAESGQSGRYVPGSQQVRPPAPKPAAKPTAARPNASRLSQSTPSRSTASGGGGLQRSAAPQASKPAMPGRKWEDFNPNRGTSRTNNPLIDDTMKARMRQREEQQATTSGSSNSEDKSKYVASNGQQYAGPAFGNGSNKSDSSAIAQKSGSEKLKDALDKQREERKKQQQRLISQRRPGSGY